MSRRRLSDDERALWTDFTRAIAPLRKSARKALEQPARRYGAPLDRGGATPPPPPVRAGEPEGRAAGANIFGVGRAGPSLRSAARRWGREREGGAGVAVKKPAPAVPPLAELGRRLKRRVARGSLVIDGRLDLHGMTQARAHDALLGFLRAAQARAGRLVLVITGKGAGGTDDAGDLFGERGVLRRQVPLWLKLPEFRRHVVGFEPAGPAHGGEGALYVRLRKVRGRAGS